MTEIYLIRHVQAEGNLYRVMQGHWDGAVTELGLLQRDALAERFRDVPVDALYASDLTRAKVTATAIQKYHDLPMQIDPRLREINVGPWEAAFFGDLLRTEPESLRHYVTHPSDWHMDGAESYGDVTARALPALREIAEANAGKSVCVVSHGVTIRCLLSAALGLDVDQKDALPIAGNTAVSHLYYENGVFRADYLNDSSHLPENPALRWERIPELWARPLDPLKERDWYAACYADAWRAAHGSLAGFSAGPYVKAAAAHRRADPGAVLQICCGEEPVGLVDLDTERGAAAGYGWVSLLYLKPEYRGRGCGVQLLGRAVLRYRELGRSALRLHVAESNDRALRFYRHWDFTELSYETNDLGRLLLMEKRLEVDKRV